MPLFRRRATRALVKPQDIPERPEDVESLERAKDAFALIESRRPWVESVVQVLTERNRLNNFGEEVTLSFTPRRSLNASDPRPLHS